MNLLALAVLNQLHSICFHQFGQGTIQRDFLAQVSGYNLALHVPAGNDGYLLPAAVVEQPTIQPRRIGLFFR